MINRPEINNLPRSVSTLKSLAIRHLPLLDMRYKSILLIPEKLATDTAPRKVLGIEGDVPHENVFVFDPQSLFQGILIFWYCPKNASWICWVSWRAVRTLALLVIISAYHFGPVRSLSNTIFRPPKVRFLQLYSRRKVQAAAKIVVQQYCRCHGAGPPANVATGLKTFGSTTIPRLAGWQTWLSRVGFLSSLRRFFADHYSVCAVVTVREAAWKFEHCFPSRPYWNCCL